MRHLKILGIWAILLGGPLVAEETAFEKAADEIVSVGRFIDQKGLCPATSGNFSIRLDSEFVAMTASGKHKGELTKNDILMVNMEGKAQNTTKKPSAETLLHTILYSLFEDISAVLHTHTLNGCVLSLLVAPKKVLVTEGYEIHKAFGITTHESTVTIPIFENNQDMVALAKEVADYMKLNPRPYGFLIRNHGLYTWGKDMREAKIRVETFEYLFASEVTMRSLNPCGKSN